MRRHVRVGLHYLLNMSRTCSLCVRSARTSVASTLIGIFRSIYASYKNSLWGLALLLAYYVPMRNKHPIVSNWGKSAMAAFAEIRRRHQQHNHDNDGDISSHNDKNNLPRQQLVNNCLSGPHGALAILHVTRMQSKTRFKKLSKIVDNTTRYRKKVALAP